MKPFDANGAFRLTSGGDELRRVAVRGAGATLFLGALGQSIQVVATVALARLLAPADFGLVAMVATFSLLLANFGLNGFTEAVLQKDAIDNGLASNLFWISIGAGLSLTIAFAASGALLARLYGDPRVAQVAVGMSLTILFTSFSVLHLALLKRAMRFSLVSTNDIIARVILVAVSVLLGWAGCGYWALVAGAVSQAFVQSAGAWYLCRWLPSRPRRLAGTSSLVRFAMNTYGRFTVNYGSRNLDNFLVGWRFDAQSLGFYKKAYDLFALSASQLTSPLANVAVSVLSRLKYDAPSYRGYLLRSLSLIAFVGMGLSGYLTLVGEDLIRVLLGPGWDPAGRIFIFFGPGIGGMLLYEMHGWIHLSIGRADRWFRWGIVEFAVTGMLFILGLRWGPAGVAVAWTASFWILFIPAFWYAGRPVEFGILPVIGVVWRYVLAALLAGLASAALIRGLPYFTASGVFGIIVRMLKISGVFGPLYIGSVIVLHQGAAPLALVGKLVQEIVPWGRQPSFPGSRGQQWDVS